MKHPKECKVCYGICDPEIHEATIAVHEYLRKRVEYALMPVVIGKPKGTAK